MPPTVLDSQHCCCCPLVWCIKRATTKYVQCISEKLNGFKIIFEMVNNIKFELFTVCSGFDLLDPKSSMRVRHLKRGPCTIREALQMKKNIRIGIQYPSSGNLSKQIWWSLCAAQVFAIRAFNTSFNQCSVFFWFHEKNRMTLKSELLIPASISVSSLHQKCKTEISAPWKSKTY